MNDAEKELVRQAEVASVDLRAAVCALSDALEFTSESIHLKGFLCKAAQEVCDKQILAMRKLVELGS